MERLANRFAARTASELKLDNDRRDVIAYGTFALLHMLLSIMLVIVFGALFGVAVEALIVSFTTSILRKYSGGAHAISPWLCAAEGTIICVGQALLISRAIIPALNPAWIMVLGVITFGWSYYIVYRLAPVDSPAKPIKREEKRRRMRKGSIIILSVYLVIAAINAALFFNTGQQSYNTYILCIYGGIVWQAFTLTRSGHKVAGIIDTFSNHILKYVRRSS